MPPQADRTDLCHYVHNRFPDALSLVLQLCYRSTGKVTPLVRVWNAFTFSKRSRPVHQDQRRLERSRCGRQCPVLATYLATVLSSCPLGRNPPRLATLLLSAAVAPTDVNTDSVASRHRSSRAGGSWVASGVALGLFIRSFNLHHEFTSAGRLCRWSLAGLHCPRAAVPPTTGTANRAVCIFARPITVTVHCSQREAYHHCTITATDRVTLSVSRANGGRSGAVREFGFRLGRARCLSYPCSL